MGLDELGQFSDVSEEIGPPRLSGLAVASLISGLLGCLIIPAVPGLILGLLAYRAIGRDPERFHGKGYAVSGIILSLISLFIVLPMALLIVPTFMKARATAQRTTCISNLKQISQALKSYSMDYDGNYPPAANWNQAVLSMGVRKEALMCPAAKSKETSYAINRLIAGKSGANLASPGETALVFDAYPGANQAGTAELLPYPNRHGDECLMAFVDGHVGTISREQMRDWYSPIYKKVAAKQRGAHKTK